MSKAYRRGLRKKIKDNEAQIQMARARQERLGKSAYLVDKIQEKIDTLERRSPVFKNSIH